MWTQIYQLGGMQDCYNRQQLDGPSYAMNKIHASVIIPTYKDWDRLQKCLDSLAKQSYPAECFEIIVVDNDHNTPQASLPPLPVNARIICQSKPGSYAARNAGVRASSGSLLLFTDSDCIPDSKWVELMIEEFGGTEPCAKIVVAGGIQLFGRDKIGGKLNLAESYDYFIGLNQHLYVKRGVAATANLAVPKSVYQELKGFDEGELSGGDGEFCRRAIARGSEVVYKPSAFVSHPLRESLSALVRKDRRLTGGKFSRDKVKTLLFALSPPVVRCKIILTDRPGCQADRRLKAMLVLSALWVSRIVEIVNLSIGRSKSR